ncbi:MAG: GNAT family N-acetyltransferase [Cyanobacteria bacterium REEB65]|nr:GNAT family N-acetyltransferase [Cyanobacteria bacterium REEB65]
MALDLVSGIEPRLKEALSIREAVFVREQGIDPELELDEFDAICWHALAYLEGEAVGTARLIFQDRFSAKIGRVAVLHEVRGHGIGAKLVRLLEDHARRSGVMTMALDAQIQVVPFYENLGYQVEGEAFVEAGIVHRRMTRRL